jgi:hypothetical protein
MTIKQSEGHLEKVSGSYLHRVLSSVLFVLAVVLGLVGLRRVMHSMFRFHTWDW